MVQWGREPSISFGNEHPMAVRRITKRESKQARTKLLAVRAAGEHALLEWLIGFERRDVSRLDRMERDDVRRNLDRFATVRDGVVLPAELFRGNTASRTPRLSRRDVADLQSRLRELLTSVRPLEPTDGMPPTRQRIPARTTEVVVVAFGSGQIDSVYLAPWPDRLWLAIIALLKKHWRTIRRCRARAGSGRCGKLFLRSNRQEFCGTRCAQRERARRWYETNRLRVLRRRREARLKIDQG